MDGYNWKTISRAARSMKEHSFISIRSNGMKMSKAFADKVRLGERKYTHCEIMVDEEKMAILLHLRTTEEFQSAMKTDQVGDGWYDLQRDGGKYESRADSMRTNIQCGVVCKLPWVKVIAQEKSHRKKRFTPIPTNHPACWVVQLMPGFCNETDPLDLTMPSGANGIYCYKSATGEVLYIGQGSIRNRFNAHARQREIPAHRFLYTVVEDEDRRIRAEDYHLAAHEREFGRLPRFNKNRGQSRGRLVLTPADIVDSEGVEGIS